jgi:hypothetical protein
VLVVLLIEQAHRVEGRIVVDKAAVGMAVVDKTVVDKASVGTAVDPSC